MINDLDRFLEAQEDLFQRALDELRSGRKQSHWMWFIFPQVCGLGQSERSKKYGIRDLAEARAYLAHPVLAGRLESATRIVFESSTHAREIFGALDYQKFISCMTLFMLASAEPSFFATVLQRLSTVDKKTYEMIERKYDNV